MIVEEVEHIMEQWAPRWAAWERDNVGLQIGDRKRRVRRVLLSLDVTKDVVREAIRRNIDLVISHHPLLFRPLTSISASERVGELVLLLAEHRIALYSAHTNLDFTRDGVSFALARKLGLQQPRFLEPLKDRLAKIAVFVPQPYVNDVMGKMSEAGAGTIGAYSSCSFQTNGRGTFRGSEESHPFEGKAGVLESAEEVRLEMVLPRARASDVVRAMKSAHPYEEVAYDLYPLLNGSPNHGMGAVGELRTAIPLESFLRSVKKELRSTSLRYAGDSNKKVRTIAVCGGSGSELLETAIRSGVDVFVTADIKYHAYHDAEGRIALVDAGHWETEHAVLPVIARKLRDAFGHLKENVSILVTKKRTTPIQSY